MHFISDSLVSTFTEYKDFYATFTSWNICSASSMPIIIKPFVQWFDPVSGFHFSHLPVPVYVVCWSHDAYLHTDLDLCVLYFELNKTLSTCTCVLTCFCLNNLINCKLVIQLEFFELLAKSHFKGVKVKETNCKFIHTLIK